MKPISWVQKSGDIQPTTDALRMISVARHQVERFKVVVYPIYKTRTIEQNSLFHALINQMSAQTGIDRDIMKGLVKDFAISRGYPYELDEDGLPKSEKGRLVPISTKDATVEQMETLIEATYEFAFDKGFDLEDYL